MPGTRHAKNNTALGYFTRHERDVLGWGSQKKRLTKDSVKKFYACTICLKLCDDPLICPNGDLFCKACIYESLLTQKRKNKQRLNEYKHQQNLQKEKLQNEIRKNTVDKFLTFDRLDKNNNKIISSSSSSNNILNKTTFNNTPSSNILDVASTSKQTPSTYTKHDKINSNPKAILSAPRQSDKKLSCFWIPSMTPNAAPTMLRAPNMNTYCPGCNIVLKLKHLKKCIFTLTVHDADRNGNDDKLEDESDDNKRKKEKLTLQKKKKQKKENNANVNKEDNRYECGSCRKILTDAMKCACLSKCGHVICLQCVKKFVAPNKCCVLCDEPCKKKNVILIACGGTGFSAHGNQMEATRNNVAFQ